MQLDTVFGLQLAGSPEDLLKIRTVNAIVDAVLETHDEP
jgi:hypothetical protein